MADEKLLTPREALYYLHEKLKPLADQYAKGLEELHKKEQLSKTTLGPRGGVEGGGAAPAPAPPAQPKTGSMLPGELTKDDEGDGMEMAEPCAKCGLKKCECAVKSEKFPDEPAPTVKKVASGQEDQGVVKKLPMAKDELAKGPPPMPGQPKMAGAAIPPPPPGMKPMKLPGVAGPKPAAPGAPMKKTFDPADLATVQKQSPGLRPRDAMKQAVKLPGARAAASKTMDTMLAAPRKPLEQVPYTPSDGQFLPGGTLPNHGVMNSVHLAPVGQPLAKPAQGVQTMVERVASKVPAPAMKAPPKIALPGAKAAAKPAAPPPVPADAKAQPKAGK